VRADFLFMPRQYFFSKIYEVQDVDGVNENGSRRQKILQNARRRIENGKTIYIALYTKQSKEIGTRINSIFYETYRTLSYLDLQKNIFVEVNNGDGTFIGIIGVLPITVSEDAKTLEIKMFRIKSEFHSVYEYNVNKKKLIGCRIEIILDHAN
jgi:hypothetical protein